MKPSSQYTLIIPHRVIQLTTISFWVPETRLRLPQVNKKVPPKRVKNPVTPSSIFVFIYSSSAGELCSQPIRGNVRRLGRMFPEHVARSFLDPEYRFVAVGRILRTIFAKQKFAQLRTKYIRRILATMFAQLRTGFMGAPHQPASIPCPKALSPESGHTVKEQSTTRIKSSGSDDRMCRPAD